MPSSYQVTPAILGRRRATQHRQSQTGRQARPVDKTHQSQPAAGPSTTGRLGRHRPSADADTERRTVPPSAEIQANIDKLLASRLVDDPQKMLSELARLGARLIIQRAVEEEFDSWLGRARYERRPDGPPGKRNGFRPRRLQTGEGE